jgi:hypothetical protein
VGFFELRQREEYLVNAGMVYWQLVGSKEAHEVPRHLKVDDIHTAVAEWCGISSKWVQVSVGGRTLMERSQVAEHDVLREL